LPAVNVQVVADRVVAVVCVIAADAARTVIVEPVIVKLDELIIAAPGKAPEPPRIIELLTLTTPAVLRMQGELTYAPLRVQLVSVDVPPATVRTSTWSLAVVAFSTQFDNE
jgi:hypothetical protein